MSLKFESIFHTAFTSDQIPFFLVGVRLVLAREHQLGNPLSGCDNSRNLQKELDIVLNKTKARGRKLIRKTFTDITGQNNYFPTDFYATRVFQTTGAAPYWLLGRLTT